MEIIELPERLDFKNKVIKYFWECWGGESNFDFYRDCMEHSIHPENDLPSFFTVLEDENIIASYALLVNDIINRQESSALVCVFVRK